MTIIMETWECKHCGKEFWSQRAVKLHVAIMHKEKKS